jgi:hypothetical protein
LRPCLELFPENEVLNQRTSAFALSLDNSYFFRAAAAEVI